VKKKKKSLFDELWERDHPEEAKAQKEQELADKKEKKEKEQLLLQQKAKEEAKEVAKKKATAASAKPT